MSLIADDRTFTRDPGEMLRVTADGPAQSTREAQKLPLLLVASPGNHRCVHATLEEQNPFLLVCSPALLQPNQNPLPEAS